MSTIDNFTKYVPAFKIIPFVDHCEKGQYFKRFALCLAEDGRGTKSISNLIVHWFLNEPRVTLVDTVSGNVLLWATEGLHKYFETTTVYEAASHKIAGIFTHLYNFVSIQSYLPQRFSRDFDCFETPRGFDILIPPYDMVRIQYDSVVGPSITFLPFRRLLLSERNLLIIFAVKVFATHFLKYMMMPLVPIGNLGWINSETASIKPSTIESINYMLATLERVRFVLSSYGDTRRKAVNIIKDNCRIVLTLEILKVGNEDTLDEDASVRVNDNFGLTFYKACGFKMNQQLVVSYANNEIIGTADAYPGDLYADGYRLNTFLLDAESRRIMEVRYTKIDEPLEVGRYALGAQCEIFSVENPNIRIAKMWVNYNRFHMKLAIVNTVPIQWKVLALVFGAKLVNRFFVKKFRNQICTPHLGYISTVSR